MSQDRQPYSNVKRTEARANQIDTHEVLKREIYRQGYDQDGNFKFQANVPIPLTGGPGASGSQPVGVGFEEWEIYFDSKFKNDASTDLTKGLMGYNLATINNNQDLKNIIEMHIGSFKFPRITNPRVQLDPVNYPSLTLTPNTPDFFFFRRLYVQVVNMPFGQAVQGNGSVNYHWEMDVDDLNSVAVHLTPLKPSFFLQRPLQSLSEIQFRFMVPLDFRPVPLMQDSLPIQMVLPPTNPARFRIMTTIDGSEALNLLIPPAIIQNLSPPDPVQIPIPAIPAPGIAVYITGAILTDGGGPPVQNLLVQQLVNFPNGLFITAVINTQPPNLPPRYVFEINDIDATLGAPVITTSNTFTMSVGYRRIAFPVRFTCVKDQLTNYISVNHD